MTEMTGKHRYKKGGLLALALCALLMLSGCIRLRITADVTEKGEVTGDMHLLVHPAALKMAGMDIDEAVRQLEEDYREQYPEAVIERISKTEDGTVMEGVAIHTIRREDIHAEVTETGMTVEFPIRSILDEVQRSANVSISTLKQYGSKAVLIINMPSPPQTNVGTVSGNTVTIDLLNIPDDINDAVITCGTVSPQPPEERVSLVRRVIIAVQTLALVMMILRLAVKKE
ncbi:MAG: hypothetical protein IKG46_07865 [Solobacterium sp.]|nr:hypothetical protein [Solobacterium sp.]